MDRRNRTSRSDAVLGLHALAATARQIILQWALLLLVIGAPVWGAFSWHAYTAATTEDTRYFLSKWTEAWIWADGLHQPSRPIVYVENGKGSTISADQLRNWEPLIALRDEVRVRVEPSVKWAGFVAATVMAAVYILLWFFGRRLRGDQFLRGARVVSPSRLRRLLRRSGPLSLLSIGTIRLRRESECQHVILEGTTGTGKSVAFGQLLDSVDRAWAAIVYDTKADHLVRTFQPEHDVVLNPLDKRCPAWTLWDEILIPTDAWRVAKSMVASHGHGDQYWVEAARQLLVDILLSVADDCKTNGELFRLCAVAETSELTTLLHGTSSGRIFVDPAGERMRESIRNTLVTSVRGLQLLDPNARPGGFSITQWVREAVTCKGTSPRAFLLSPPDHAPAIMPIIAVWIEAAAAAILALGPSRTRRILFAIDELPTLPVLEYVVRLAAEGRGYGASVVMAVQSFAQLRQRYGADGADALAALFSTHVLFRAADSESAERVSKILGESEHDVARQSENAGTGRSLSVGSDRQSHRVVTATEMLQLPNLEAYLRVAGDFPLCRLRLTPTDTDAKTVAYVPRDPATLIHRPVPLRTPVPPATTIIDQTGPL
ncbi:type IV secretion system DNA-binding domain-containing protein [Dyella sp. S184]|uniref:type IV secretion system DNA-binding domain-containing protein n=1 Tax=Dyella sp. S184 TaxID=1641862 RepID=UPI00131B44BF|nr:type IV secretion system DNA-binding domain-containing protein [Dyella sp. S184]